MSAPADSPRELAEAMRIFLVEHVAALGEADVEAATERARDAVAGLLETVATTLPALVDRADDAPALGRAMPPATEPPGASWARALVRRRCGEAEGALLQLRLALAPTAPAAGANVRRRACLAVVRDALAAVGATLDLWASAPRDPMPAREAVRLARQCLVAGEPSAAAPLIRRALLGGLNEPCRDAAPAADLVAAWAEWDGARRQPDVPRAATHEAWDATLASGDDALRMWAALDVAERLVNVASMTAPTPTESRRAGRDP